MVENSVLFFDNLVGRNCRLSKVVSDVNNSFGEGVIIGAETGRQAMKVSVVGWNNSVPTQSVIGEGATISPELKPASWKKVVEPGEVPR